MKEIHRSTFPIRGGQEQITARPAGREDWPGIVELNCTVPDRPWEKPPEELSPEERAEYGGPWMSLETLIPHYQEYEKRGFPILVAENAAGQIVGHLDLWLVDEPEPVGVAACAEVVMEHAHYVGSGLENALLRYAGEVAREIGRPVLEGGMGIGGLSDDYVPKRALGFRIWDEHDRIEVACVTNAPGCAVEPVDEDEAAIQGLTVVGRWAPSGFIWSIGRRPPTGQGRFGLEVEGRPGVVQAVDAAEWGGGTAPGEVQDVTFYVPAPKRHDAGFLSSLLGTYAALSGRMGARSFRTWVPCSVTSELRGVTLLSAQYAGAWLRKGVI
jgi:hypothetical protein